MNQNGIWLTLIEYAHHKKISISTIRRSIKAGHVNFKEENGKYLIWTKQDLISNEDKEIELLRKKNRELEEEVNDLKMLLMVYENQTTAMNNEIPPLPLN